MTAEKSFFRVACQDAARIVSILSLNSADVTKPPQNKSKFEHMQEKAIFFGRFFHMVFLKGFTPVVFDMLPYRIWQLLTFAIYIYRLVFLPFWLRLTGYGKYASWTEPKLGSSLPNPKSKEAVCANNVSLSVETRLSVHDFGDPEYEKLLQCLYTKTTHLSPHSQSPGHPFVTGFPGNFMDHLTGVYKILLAWKQPQFVVRAGMFHSVYGTYDYRAGVFDLRDGREPLRTVVGPGAEELAFAICTSDRLGLMRDLLTTMYGAEYVSGWGLLANVKRETLLKNGDGNPYPKLSGHLGAEGFPVRNHITQKVHVVSSDFFAHFIIVFVADFMDQGALAIGSSDMDICLFQFIRFRFFNDVLRFVAPYLQVWKKYMWDKPFTEPTRAEIIAFTKIWENSFEIHCSGDVCTQGKPLSPEDKKLLLELMNKYPYLPEVRIALALGMAPNEIVEGQSRVEVAAQGKSMLEEWGMLSLKNEEIPLKVVLSRINKIFVSK